MTAPAPANRSIRFEISTWRDGRWAIESARDDEAEALAVAKRLFENKACEGVRVMREHEAWGRLISSTQIHEERRTPERKPVPRLAASDDDDCWCESLDDLYGARARRTIGQLLRAFLDQLAITPTELLHNFRFFRRLDGAEGLLSAAVNRIVRARASATGGELRAVLKDFEQLLALAVARAREVGALRAVPRLGEGGLDALLDQCRRAVPEPGDQLYLFRHAVCRTLEGCNNLGDRLENALAWLDAARAPEAEALADALVADCLGSAPLVQDMLGLQPDLGTALAATIEVARGRYEGTPQRAPAWFAALRARLAARACPETRAVLLARVRRELAGDRPLARGAAAEEGQALTLIGDRLKDEAEGCFAGGAGLVAALARRWSKLDLPGGFGDLRVPNGAPAARLRALLDYAPEAIGDARKRALATVALDVLRTAPASARAELAPLAGAFAAARLGDAAKAAIAREFAAFG